MQYYNCQEFIERTVCRIVSPGEGESQIAKRPSERSREMAKNSLPTRKRRRLEDGKDEDRSVEKLLGDYLSVSTSLLLKGKKQSPSSSQEDETLRKERERALLELDRMKDRLTKAYDAAERYDRLPRSHPLRKAVWRDYELKLKTFEEKMEEVYGIDCSIEDDIEGELI